MKLDDPAFCVGTYLSEQLVDGCNLEQQQALLARVQQALLDSRAASSALASENALSIKQGQERRARALREVEELKKRQEDSQRVLQQLDEQFAAIHIIQNDLECVEHAQEYVLLLSQVEQCSNAVKDIAQQLQQQQQHNSHQQDQKLEPQQVRSQNVVDYAALIPMCNALTNVLTSFAGATPTSELRNILSTRMRLLFVTFKPHILEITHALLKAGGWPQAPKKASSTLTSALRCMLLTQKIEIELNDETAEEVMCGPRSLLGLMMKPLALRFRFHFSDKQASNRVDKPEWITAFLLRIIHDNSDFVLTVVQPLVAEYGIDRNVLEDFIRATYNLARSKFERQLAQLSVADDVAMFRHVVDELVVFEHKLQENHYPTPGLITILTKASLFKQWLAVDKQSMGEALEALTALPQPWDLLQSGIEKKLSKDQRAGEATVAGDAFLALLARFSTRYVVLPSLDLRLRFLETVQLKAVKRFQQHLRAGIEDQLPLLEQNKSERWRLACGLLSTVHYVMMSLKEWGETENFLELALHQARCSALEAGLPFSDSSYFPTVFEAPLEAYSHLLNDSIQQLTDLMVESFQARAGNFHLSTDKPKSLGEAVLSVKWQLSQLAEHLGSSTMFRGSLRALASGLDQLLFGVVAEEGKFSQEVAAQFVSDVQTLLSLFPNPDQHFPYLHDAVTLLAMPLPELQKLTAHLENLSPLDHRAVLAAHSVFKLNQLQVNAILSRVILSDDGALIT